MTKAEYLQAVDDGLWKILNGKKPSQVPIQEFKSNADVAAASAQVQAITPSGTAEVKAPDDIRTFAFDIAEPTRKAKLDGSQKNEKFLIVERNADNELIVTSIAALGQGGRLPRPTGTETVIHTHHRGMPQPPHKADNHNVRRYNQASFVIAAETKKVYEIGRVSGDTSASIRLVGPNNTVGQWVPFQVNARDYYTDSTATQLKPQYRGKL